MRIEKILKAVPQYQVFPSVSEIYNRIRKLSKKDGFSVSIIGKSEGGHPIHRVKFGTGRIRVLFAAYPHPNEPIGGLTVLTLISLLHEGHPALRNLPIEWNFVPCPDPDGVMANEGWMRKSFSFKRYLDQYYRPPHDRQIEWSFPVRYKKARFGRPMKGTRALMKALKQVKPDFYFSLHNSMFGGAYYFISKDLGPKYFGQLYRLLRVLGIPLHRGEPEVDWVREYSPAIYGEVTFKGMYDRLAESFADPTDHWNGGASSFDYLRRFNPRSLTLVFETAFALHPLSRSIKLSGENRRHLMLKTIASQKFLTSLALEHWRETRAVLDKTSVLYPAVRSLMEKQAKTLTELDKRLLTSKSYDRLATESERLDIYLTWFIYLCTINQFVRLLRNSRAVSAVAAAQVLSTEIRSQYRQIDAAINFDSFRNFEVRDLVRAQLGSGLIALGALLKGSSK